MKPISLRFQCFGPYMEEQFIDFEQLEKNGILLICGDTGAGKTTILDAVCCALYGEASGGRAKEGGRGDVTSMRCKLAGREDITRIEYIFEIAGRRYQFWRSIRMARKNITEEQNCLEYREGSYVPLLANPKKTAVNEQAEKIIGLNYDQFRQVVMLPQGKFEKLLVSDSANKEDILNSLFQTEFWSQVAERISEVVNGQEKQLRQEEQEISVALSQFGCDSVEGLETLISSRRQQENDLIQEKLRAEQDKKLRESQYNEALVVEERFNQLDEAEKKWEELKKQDKSIQEKEKQVKLIDEGERLRSVYEDYERKKAACQRQQASNSTALAELEEAGNRLRQSGEAIARHQEEREAYEGYKKDLHRYQDAGDSYDRLAEAEVKWKREKKQESETRKKWETAKGKLEECEKQYEGALKAQEAAGREFDAARNVYLQGIGGILAQKLAAGAPCPVCGSLEHPAPARLPEGHMTEEEVNRLENKKKKADKAEHSSRKEMENVRREKEAAEAIWRQTNQEMEIARAALDTWEAQKFPGVDTRPQLEKAIEDIQKKMEEYEEEDRKLGEADLQARAEYEKKKGAAESIGRQLQQAEEEWKETSAHWQAVLAASVFADEGDYCTAVSLRDRRDDLWKEVTGWEERKRVAQDQYEKQKKELKASDRPDIGRLEEKKRESGEQFDRKNQELSVLQDRISTMEQAARGLKERKEDCDKRRLMVEDNQVFAKRLRGESGVGLQRYVLGVMLSYITVEANQLLKLVHGGRYQLNRTDEAAGSAHKKGLELEVFDSRTQERRSVTTLSGGERFLASLCLAIGLTTVVQAQGNVKIGAMFIDEGFGTLDEESIEDALEVLQHVRRNNGLVAVISHHEKLAETIGNKIRVVGGRRGSRIVW